MLESELDEQLGYDRYDIQNKRNRHRNKKVRSDFGEVDISIPKDISTRYISAHINSVYGIEVSPSLISKITNIVIQLAKEWQNRSLDIIYPVIFMNSIHYKVRTKGRIVNRAAYIAIGINLEGSKEVLGIWIGQNETSKYWLNVLTEIKNRWVKDILIVSVDGLTGFVDSIKAVYPYTEIQRCVVHQIRNTLNHISYKHKRDFARDLKQVYTASTEENALSELALLEEKLDDKYAIALRSWRNNWDELSTYFKYPEHIRILIYTTNAMESYNRMLRKVTKSKSVFPSDDSLHKSLYLATMDISYK